jgi:protein TonB
MPEAAEQPPTEPIADLDSIPPTDNISAPPLFGMPSIAVPGTISAGTTAIPETSLFGSTLGGPTLGAAPPSAGRMGPSSIDVGLMPMVRIQPEYPLEARRQKLEGWVKVEMTVLENGSVTNVKIRDAKPAGVFDQAVLKAVAQWKFRPSTVDGKPARGKAVQTLRFNLDS